MSRLLFFWKIIRKQKGTLYNRFLIVLICAVIMLLFPYFTGKMIDQVFYAGNTNFLYKTIIIFTVLYMGNELMLFINYLIAHHISRTTLLELKELIFNHVLKSKSYILNKMSDGEVGTVINEDTMKILDIYYDTFPYMFADIIRLIVITIILVSISPLMVFSLLPIAAIITFLTKALGKTIASKQAQLRDKHGEFIGTIIDLISGINSIKLMPNEEYLNCIVEENCEDLTKLKKKNVRIEFVRDRFVQLITLLGTIALYFVSAKLIEDNVLTVGLFFSVMEYFTLSMKYINNLSGRYALIQKGMVSVNKVFTLLNEEIDDEEKGEIVIPNIGDIKFRNILFNYDDVNVFKDFNLNIKGGITTAIVGKSGSGKTTIIEMLARIFNPESGSITYNEKNIDEFSLMAWRKHVGIMLQENVIFDDLSLRDNILLGETGIDDEEILKTCEEVKLGGLLNRLPDSIDTIIKKESLSGGERQKIAFARMLIRKQSFVIMDESTSALDVESERSIINMIIEKFKGKTLIIVSHRPYSVANANEIIMIDQGDVIDRGTNDELMSRCKSYRNLFRVIPE